MDGLQWVGLVAAFSMAVPSAMHALLFKRDPTAAFGWIALCVLFPFVGPLLYFMLGINRIHQTARKLRGAEGAPLAEPAPIPGQRLPRAFEQQARISHAVTGLALTGGNAVTLHEDGDEAYPPMLAAIDGARECVYLATYIFENNRMGRAFADALIRAHDRGVTVKVLLDGAGEWYSWPRIRHRLRRRGVDVARFLPPRLLPPRLVLNLRNHRKLLIVDDAVAFTGGMNIGDRHMRRNGGDAPTRDYHFRVAGPVVAQMITEFVSDWQFTTGENLPLPVDVPPGDGSAHCRVIANGPNEDLDRLTMVLVGAISAARERVVIMTPYFLPPREIVAALQAASIRGLRVDVILPGRNNLPFMHWATRNMLWELVRWGVNVHYRPGSFSHAKLFMCDAHYLQIGSANLDPRSLKLNFELMVEIFDTEFGAAVTHRVDETLLECRRVSMDELDGRPLLPRVRDAICWLFTPYL